MKETQPETPANDTKAKPGKFWLWGLAVFQLLAVMLLTWFGIEETMIKLAGFVILLLCGSMDIKAIKNAGYQVPRWWWGLAVFLPPVYMIVRVCKTDKAPAERVKRFAPVIVWVLLLGLLMALGVLSAITEESSTIEQRYNPASSTPSTSLDFGKLPSSYRDAMAGKMLHDFLAEQLDENGVLLKVVEVSNVELIENNGNSYQWAADVTLRTRKEPPASDVFRYTLSYNGETDYLSYALADADEDKYDALVEKSAE